MNLLNSLSSPVSFSKDVDNTWMVNELQCSLIRVGKTLFWTKNKVVPSSFSHIFQLPTLVTGSPGHPARGGLWAHPELTCSSSGSCTHIFGGFCSPSPCFTSTHLGQCKVGRQKQCATPSHGPPSLVLFRLQSPSISTYVGAYKGWMPYSAGNFTRTWLYQYTRALICLQ